MDEKRKQELIQKILEFAAEGATFGQFSSEFGKQYGEEEIRQTVRALTQVGMLWTRGRTRGTVYATSEDGFSYLERLK